jgi:predicted glycosyltransferase
MRVSCRVMFYVQHLLGIGHLKRASLIARAIAAAELDVSVVLGGREVSGVDFAGCARILLPSVHAADETFKTLLDERSEPIDDEWRDNRNARLVFEFEALRPHVLMLESFPFGRRMFSFELLPLLTAARAAPRPPRIVSSVRDILVRKPDVERNRKAVTFAHAWFDRILVHGDPKLIPIEASFPEMAEIADKVAYTGYVVETDEPPVATMESPIGEGEVIVSVGGGAVGLPLLRTALAAKPLSRLADRTWRLITGPNLPDKAVTDLAWSPPPGIIIERWRADLPALFRTCAVSVSQAGYNTVMDLLRARARTVLVPFAAGGETEQTLRARVLAERGLAVAVDTATLSPKILADAIDEALTLSPPCVEIDCTGAETTARLVGEMCEAGGT